MSGFEGFIDQAEVKRRVEIRKDLLRKQIKRMQDELRLLEDALNDDEELTRIAEQTVAEDLRVARLARKGAGFIVPPNAQEL